MRACRTNRNAPDAEGAVLTIPDGLDYRPGAHNPRRRCCANTDSPDILVASMASPCKRCGATKTEPVRRDWTYHLVEALGYRLRACSNCRRKRIVPKSIFTPNGEGTVYQVNGAATKDRELPSGQGRADFDPDGFSGCPRCAGRQFERTHRTWLERKLNRPLMARCLSCSRRFPFPRV